IVCAASGSPEKCVNMSSPEQYASSLSSGEYFPGSLQDKILSDGCLEKEQMVVSAIASTPCQFFGTGATR
ncbi:hypothetical protein, partial [Escherichia coli]|uniref:hypothetical protein n=1 Tax=Escherichia coli TaxID=562 RepID=UPI001BDCF5AB